MNTLYKNPFKKISAKRPNNEDNIGIAMIDTNKLCPNPLQPRFIFEDEPMLRLADSIRRYGILQPLSVRPVKNEEGEIISYEIIAGERRWRAAGIIGMQKVPCIIIDVDSKKSAELAIIENIQREDLNIFEQAAAISSLIDIYGLTQEMAAKQLSSSQSYVANKLRLLKLTPKERSEIIRHNLSERHARALLRLDSVEDRLAAIQVISSKELNVSATEKYIDKLLYLKPEVQPDNKTFKGSLRDIKFFYNSIDKAVDILRACGVPVFTDTKNNISETVIQIQILHRN